MRSIIVITILFFCQNSFAQHAYKDSLKIFQSEYIANLYRIIKSDTAHIDFYPINESMIVAANVAVLNNEAPFKMMTSSGKTKDAQKYATLKFTLSGKECVLSAYQLLKLREQDSSHLFIPFTDETCGETSYGGGRYIDLDIKDIKNNIVIIDFNKAYNPYCAFTSGYNCPIPPRENALPVPVNAGERYQADKFHH